MRFAPTLLGAALVLGLPLLAPRPVAASEVLDRVVAVVGDDIILESDLDLWMFYDERVSFELQKLGNPTPAQLEQRIYELRPMALDELIGRKLLLAQGASFQVTASEQEVDTYLQTLARNSGLGGIPELREAVENSARYGTWVQYRGKLREDIIIYKLESMLLNVSVSDAQVRERYRELSKGEEAKIEVRRLVFKAGDEPGQRDAVLKQANAAVRSLAAGQEFAAVAEALGQSDESETLTRSSVSRPIGERLFKAKEGDVIGPLQSGQGFLVFVVDAVIASDLIGFEAAKEELRRQLFDEAMTKARDELFEQLRARNHVDIRL